MQYVLSMEGISKSFPGVKALQNVNINVMRGEVHALVGENGAGKSTLMKILSGVFQPETGKIYLDGHEVVIENTKKAHDLGIGIVFQEFNLCNDISVADNIFIGRHKNKYGFVDDKWLIEETQKVMDYMNLAINPTSIVKTLSVAEKQLVEIAKVVSMNANVIVFDEPTSALTEKEIVRLFEIIKILRDQGKAIFYISHRLNELDAIADRVTVLRDGEHVQTADYKDVTKDELIQWMVGRELKNQYPVEARAIGETFFEAKHVKRKDLVDVDGFYVKRGEIVGFAGLIGAGRTETARAIFGADESDYMELYVNGKQVHVHNPDTAIKNSIGYLTDERKESGLALRLDVEKNINMASYKQLAKNGFYSQKLADENARNYVENLVIKTPSIRKIAMYLSGGNQQKVILAKWLCKEMQLLIFDEPTRGIDVGAKYEIYKLMNKLSGQGIGIILISSDLPEILGMSDRIYVFCRGKITGEMSRDEASQEKILQYAAGI